ncbi:MAG TPA: phosphoenolpyruvate carboxykinase domain-containing protein [Rhodanobacter sp.]
MQVFAKLTSQGILPAADDLRLAGLELDRAALDQLLAVDHVHWQTEMAAIGEYLDTFVPRLPERLHAEQQRVVMALDAMTEQPQREVAAR